MSIPTVLLQLDSDPQASVFDGVVAVDAGVDHLFRHGGIKATQAQELVHGAMFTRGPEKLKNTAIFIGGSNVANCESLLAEVEKCFFGPLRVSVMMDANGCNSTAAAAVISAGRHIDLSGAKALVLAATGPVGQRVTRLLAKAGTKTLAASRSLERANAVCDEVRTKMSNADLTSVSINDNDTLRKAIESVDVVIAAGAAGVELLPAKIWQSIASLRVAIDLNAVSPVGIGAIAVTDKAVKQAGTITYGAIGVGGLKMKIHKASLRALFRTNDQVLDCDEIYEIGTQLTDS